MTQLANAQKESSRVSTLAFQATPRFTLVLGRAHERFSQKKEVTDKQTNEIAGRLKEVIQIGNEFIAAWQDYLNVSGLHSPGCLRAAFTTVSTATDLFRELGNFNGSKRALWGDDKQDRLLTILEQMEDIQENLALLIDDDARGELQRILTEAGMDGRVLVPEDAEAS